MVKFWWRVIRARAQAASSTANRYKTIFFLYNFVSCECRKEIFQFCARYSFCGAINDNIFVRPGVLDRNGENILEYMAVHCVQSDTKLSCLRCTMYIIVFNNHFFNINIIKFFFIYKVGNQRVTT